MRSAGLIPALVALFLSGAASAQVWQEYVNRDNNFQINFPAEPTTTETQYRTVKGTMLRARVFTAVAPAGSITAGTYKVTIVDYSTALNEIGDAIEQARATIKAKGTTKYDEVNDLDRHREWRMTVETATTRILASTLIAANNRLYIAEGETALSAPPPAQFHVSLQILNEEGVRIRQLTYIAAPEDEIAPISEKANALEAQRLTALVSGTWRNPAGGSCQAGSVHVRPRRVALGDTVEVVTTLRAGGTAMPRLTVFFYDGDPEAGGQVFGIKRVGSLGAHEAREVHASFRPTRCGTYQLVVIAGKGTPFEAERTARPLHVDCGRQDRR